MFNHEHGMGYESVPDDPDHVLVWWLSSDHATYNELILDIDEAAAWHRGDAFEPKRTVEKYAISEMDNDDARDRARLEQIRAEQSKLVDDNWLRRIGIDPGDDEKPWRSRDW